MKKNYKNIVIAQTESELKFIYNNLPKKKNYLCVPINLQTQLYCIKKNISYYDPINLINNKFHKEALITFEKLIKNIKFEKSYNLSERIEIKILARYYFNSAIFLIEIISQLKKKIKINKIFVSGWFRYDDTYSKYNYYVSFLLKSLYKKKVHKILNQKIKYKKKIFNNNYKLVLEKKLKNKKIIIITNLGYNLFRIINYFFKSKKNYYFLTPINHKISWIKKVIFKFLNLYFFEFKPYKSNKRITIKPLKLSFKFRKNFNISKLLNFRIDQEHYNLIKNKLKFISFQNYFSNKDVSSVISNATRGLNGIILDYANLNKIPFFCIPHGTLSSNFDRFHRIYNDAIADSVTYPKSIFFSQSKISKNFYEKRKKKFKNIKLCGNILYSEEKFKKNSKNKSILYAVTMRGFENIQFLGVEMYYEYLQNLSFLNNLAFTNNLKIFVKNHQSIENLNQALQKKYINLNFTNEKIDKVIASTNLVISFSSSVIEDALYSYKPVILFDQWNRYMHCNSEKNPERLNEAIYYVNKKNNLLKCINTIFKSKKINFNKYIYKGASEKNIKKLFLNY